jgi:hypothetical protein
MSEDQPKYLKHPGLERIRKNIPQDVKDEVDAAFAAGKQFIDPDKDWMSEFSVDELANLLVAYVNNANRLFYDSPGHIRDNMMPHHLKRIKQFSDLLIDNLKHSAI